MTSFCKITDLENESDVEQKLIYPLLTKNLPVGLGYRISEIRTKTEIRKIKIGKGRTAKRYYPDYLIVIEGMPLCLVEAKSPNENLSAGVDDGRLYASEINAKFPNKINPCSLLVISNGKELAVFNYDCEDPIISLNTNEIFPGGEKFEKLLDTVSRKSITSNLKEIQNKLRGTRKFSRPISLLGGASVQGEEVGENSFGSNLILEYDNLIDPVDKEDRLKIVRNAYISSEQRKKHLEPINKIIRAAKPASLVNAESIENTKKPLEIFSKLLNPEKKVLQDQLLILVGNVGCGKSTFVDYIQEVALSDNLKKETQWISMDLNNAPVNREEIYDWVREEIIKSFEEYFPDLHSLDNKLNIYSVELRKIEQIAEIHGKNSEKYKELLANELIKLTNDKQSSARALIRYYCNERGKLPILVLDNCDNRNKEDQLLMFKVAKWVKKEFKCLVFLPMRDITYDNHKSEPPLDTVIKGLIFRIDPPDLKEVLYQRINYILKNSRNFEYALSNGSRVLVDAGEQKKYFDCMLKSLFDNDPFFKKLTIGIAGRDIRRGLELFINFCKSGYIKEEEIFRMRATKGGVVLPSHITMRVFLRGSNRYFSDSSSPFIKNLFLSYPEEALPDPYARLLILRWLDNRRKEKGPNGSRGYHKVSKLIKELGSLGCSEERLSDEVRTLAINRCILTEFQYDLASTSSIAIDEEDLISISPAGIIHLGLLKNINYLSSCAEDVWYDKLQTAQNIASIISGPRRFSLDNVVGNAKSLINYLIDYRSEYFSDPSDYLSDIDKDILDFSDSSEVIKDTVEKNKLIIDKEEIKKQHRIGEKTTGRVLKKINGLCFIKLASGCNGVIKENRCSSDAKVVFDGLSRDDEISIRVAFFNDKYNNFDLEINSNYDKK